MLAALKVLKVLQILKVGKVLKLLQILKVVKVLKVLKFLKVLKVLAVLQHNKYAPHMWGRVMCPAANPCYLSCNQLGHELCSTPPIYGFLSSCNIEQTQKCDVLMDRLPF